MAKFKTVAVSAAKLAIYRKRATECRVLAANAYTKRMWFGTCINATHAAIALADCLSIVRKQLRYAGSNHDQAVNFYATLQIDDPQFKKSIQQLGKIISMKHVAEYMGDPIKQKDAETCLKQLERFEDFIDPLLP